MQYLPGGPDRPPPTAAKRPASAAARKSSTTRGAKKDETRTYTDVEKAKREFKIFLEDLLKSKKWAKIMKEQNAKQTKTDAQTIFDIAKNQLEDIQVSFRIMFNVMLLQVRLKDKNSPLSNDAGKLINLFNENRTEIKTTPTIMESQVQKTIPEFFRDENAARRVVMFRDKIQKSKTS